MRTISKLFIAILSLLITATSITACSKKADEPQKTEHQSDNLSVSDLKYEIELSAPKVISASFIATRVEPNIYRDGKLVSQGDYSSEDEDFKSLKTTITHKGRVLYLSIIFSRTHGDEDESPISILIKAKIYRNNKLIQEYIQTRTLKNESSISEQLQVLGTE